LDSGLIDRPKNGKS